MKQKIIVGLKRASWLFAVIVGLITMVIVASGQGWDYPECYLPGTIAATVIGFVLFRIGIWVYEGFIEKSKEGSDKE